MSSSELKNIQVEVSKECWKRLKIVSIQKEIALSDLAKEILEKFASRKSNEEEK